MAECYLVIEFADDGLLAVIPEYGWDIDGSGCALSPPYKADLLHKIKLRPHGHVEILVLEILSSEEGYVQNL